MEAAIIVFCVAGILFISLFSNGRSKIIRQLRKEREAVSLDAFYQEFEKENLSRDITKTIYHKVQAFLKMDKFVFHANENLKEILKLDKEEVRDIITDVCTKLNINYPRFQDLESYQEEKGEITTIKEMIYFISFFNQEYLIPKKS